MSKLRRLMGRRPADDATAKWMNAFAEMSMERNALLKALRKVTFMARTSGSIRDEGLCAACDEAEALIAKYLVTRKSGSGK
jgi:hypothetical protein